MTAATKTDMHHLSLEELAMAGINRLVYVKEIAARDVPGATGQGLAEDAPLYAICAANGVQLSIVDNREAAFSDARQHNLEPVSVH